MDETFDADDRKDVSRNPVREDEISVKAEQIDMIDNPVSLLTPSGEAIVTIARAA